MLTVAAASTRALWYLTRGTGVASLLLLTASVLLGILGPLRFARPGWPRFSFETLHRDVSLLVLAILFVHIVTSVLDTFAPIGILDAVIPLHSSYRPLWLGLGALSFDLLVALVITSLLRRRLGFRRWRAIHWLAYLSWPVAVLHGIGTGTDAKLSWMLALTAGCLAAVVIAVLVRVATAVVDDERARVPAAVATVATALGIAVFTLLGPLQHGWARRAGTPMKLLAVPTSARRVATAARAPSSAARASRPPRSSFSARLDGTVTQRAVSGGAIVDLAMRLSGGTRGQLRVRLAGVPDGGGGLSMTGSQVDLLTPGMTTAMQGQIVSLQGQSFVARVSGGPGPAIDLQASLNIDGAAQTVTGQVSARPAGGGG